MFFVFLFFPSNLQHILILFLRLKIFVTHLWNSMNFSWLCEIEDQISMLNWGWIIWHYFFVFFFKKTSKAVNSYGNVVTLIFNLTSKNVTFYETLLKGYISRTVQDTKEKRWSYEMWALGINFINKCIVMRPWRLPYKKFSITTLLFNETDFKFSDAILLVEQILRRTFDLWLTFASKVKNRTDPLLFMNFQDVCLWINLVENLTIKTNCNEFISIGVKWKSKWAFIRFEAFNKQQQQKKYDIHANEKANEIYNGKNTSNTGWSIINFIYKEFIKFDNKISFAFESMKPKNLTCMNHPGAKINQSKEKHKKMRKNYNEKQTQVK